MDLSALDIQEFNGVEFLTDMALPLTTGLCIFGTSGADSISGGDGDDIIYGFDGSDTLVGGPGSVGLSSCVRLARAWRTKCERAASTD